MQTIKISDKTFEEIKKTASPELIEALSKLRVGIVRRQEKQITKPQNNQKPKQSASKSKTQPKRPSTAHRKKKKAQKQIMGIQKVMGAQAKKSGKKQRTKRLIDEPSPVIYQKNSWLMRSKTSNLSKAEQARIQEQLNRYCVKSVAERNGKPHNPKPEKYNATTKDYVGQEYGDAYDEAGYYEAHNASEFRYGRRKRQEWNNAKAKQQKGDIYRLRKLRSIDPNQFDRGAVK